MKKEDFLEHYKTLDTELLFKVAGSKNNEYVESAVEAAKEELLNRGIKDSGEDAYIENYSNELAKMSYQEHCNALENRYKPYNDKVNQLIKESFKKNIKNFKNEELAKVIVGQNNYFHREIINLVKEELIYRKKTQIRISSENNDARNNIFILKCPKCNSYEHTQGEIRVTHGTLTQLFDIQSEIFVSVSCNDCGYTEFYKVKHNKLLNTIIELLV